jgi:hypothetical protein
LGKKLNKEKLVANIKSRKNNLKLKKRDRKNNKGKK